LTERIKQIHRAKGDKKKEAESIAQSITSALSANEAAEMPNETVDPLPASLHYHQRLSIVPV